MADPKPYEIYAIKYGDHQRLAGENFIGGDPHNGPMPIDYFVWAIKGAEQDVDRRHRASTRKWGSGASAT